jgi:hypothetical protein
MYVFYGRPFRWLHCCIFYRIVESLRVGVEWVVVNVWWVHWRVNGMRVAQALLSGTNYHESNNILDKCVQNRMIDTWYIYRDKCLTHGILVGIFVYLWLII